MEQMQYEALLAVLSRIAGALEAAKPVEPDAITLPIGAYKSFDWAQINCRVFADDDFGVSQVFCMNDGRVYTRRTNDKFGSEIWFSRGDGKAADGTPRYKRLIEFREIKDAEPIGRKAEQALKKAPETHTPALNPPVATLGEHMAASQPPSQQVIEQKPPRIEIPSELRKDWLHWHDQAAKFGAVPAELGLYDVDTIASVKDKVASLIQLVEAGATIARDKLADELAAFIAGAKQVGVDVPAEFYDIDHATLDVIELRIGTIKNLITAKQGAQAMTESPTAQPPMVIDTAGVIRDLRIAAVKSGGRTMNKWQAAEIVQALESIAGSKESRQQFTRIVFERESYADLSDAQRYALHAWLRPAKRNNVPMATNPRAAIELRAVLAAQPQQQEVPA